MPEFKSTIGTFRAPNLQSFDIFTTKNTKIINHTYAPDSKFAL